MWKKDENSNSTSASFVTCGLRERYVISFGYFGGNSKILRIVALHAQYKIEMSRNWRPQKETLNFDK